MNSTGAFDAGLRELVNSLKSTEPGSPWRQTVNSVVGGLEAVGVLDEHVLVVSSNGRGVFDARGGTLVTRDTEEPTAAWLSEAELEATGIGPLAGRRVRLAGLYGGGLSLGTGDGWSISTMAPAWPEVCVVLQSNWASLLLEPVQPGRHMTHCRAVARVRELRAAGFSTSGRTLIVATSSELRVYHRE